MFSTIRSRLFLLVLIVAVPLVAATLLVIEKFAASELNAQEQTLLSATHAIAAAVEAEIKKYVSVGYALGTSVSLQIGDFETFATQAKTATEQLPGSWVVVANVEGLQLVNTLKPFGENLPPIAPLYVHELALTTRTFQVGDIVIGPVAQRPALGVFVPIFKAGEPQFDIVIGLDPHVFTRILDDQRLPSGWVAGIGDRKGHFVARSIENDRFLLEPISEGWRDASQKGREGYFNNISKEGIPLHSSFKNLDNSGWTISVGASQALLNQSLRNSLWIVASTSISLIGLSLVLAWIAARSIIRSMKSLENASVSLLQNEAINVSRTGLRDVDNAVAAFESAAKAILEREDRHTLLIKELNHRVKNLFAIIGGIVSLSGKTAVTPQEMGKAIRGRVDALARAHELILPKIFRSHNNIPQATGIDVLLRAILTPYTEPETGAESKIIISGPPFNLVDKAATSLALVFHEFATNAAKYGALSTDSGRLSVTWIGAGSQMSIKWQETCAPPRTDKLIQEGFGSVLADRSVRGQLGGAIRREWQSEGLLITLLIPLEHLEA